MTQLPLSYAPTDSELCQVIGCRNLSSRKRRTLDVCDLCDIEEIETIVDGGVRPALFFKEGKGRVVPTTCKLGDIRTTARNLFVLKGRI